VDVLVGLDIIEHFTKDELMGFLSKAKKCLNPGGKIILRTPNMDAPQTSLYAFGDISHETFLNKSSALQVLNSIGFLNTRVYGGLVRNQNPLLEIIRRIRLVELCHFSKVNFILFCSYLAQCSI
jgi:cyclopropane fatty-acyl-phospholipid synthase-like methyltransferase